MGAAYDASMRGALALLVLLPFAAFAGDELTPLSDEFNDASTLANWKRVYAVEGWPANQLEQQDINGTIPGKMRMMPFTSTWYNDYRGELTFKEVQGDLVVTTDVTSTQRNGAGAPSSLYSLAGILVRNPRQITPATWQPGRENYIFLALGAANAARTFQYEVKTTVNGISTIVVSSAAGNHAVIQVARLGPHVITLRNDGTGWVVHRRYYRPDFASIMQVGMTVYTDFPFCFNNYTPFAHNSTVIHGGNADLVGAFDYFRFERPAIPAALADAAFSDANAVTDAQLLSFLGANATANTTPATSRRRASRH